MKEASPANLELAIMLPLGVVVNQLMNIGKRLGKSALDFIEPARC